MMMHQHLLHLFFVLHFLPHYNYYSVDGFLISTPRAVVLNSNNDGVQSLLKMGTSPVDDEVQSLFGRLKNRYSSGGKEKTSKVEKIPNQNDDVMPHIPSKDMTGVDPDITRLCATLSEALYDIVPPSKNSISAPRYEEMPNTVEKKSSENDADDDDRAWNKSFSTKNLKVDTIFLDSHGALFASSAPFAGIVAGDKLILGWRGTNSLIDALNDLAISPQSSIPLKKYRKHIKQQGAFLSMATNDLINNEEMILDTIEKYAIKEIVCTGHSLGGGLAQTAHLLLRGLSEDTSSSWSVLREKEINVRSLNFEGPMTTVLCGGTATNPEAKTFIEAARENSCNFAFSNDFIPRGYGYMSFIIDLIDNVEEQATDDANKKVPWPLSSYLDTDGKIGDMFDSTMNNEKIVDGVGVAIRYSHLGNVICYASHGAKPEVTRDYGPRPAAPQQGSEHTTIRNFRDIKYIPVDRPIDGILDWHMGIISPGLCFTNDELV